MVTGMLPHRAGSINTGSMARSASFRACIDL
jgi:hypothetical protein